MTANIVDTTPEIQTVEECPGFDRFSGQRWIYPNNMPVRGYQKRAVELALFNNAMIVLPTGFGKTFIAAVVMYNFYRWYPEGKVIFVAPTRPLVAQQIQECKKISGIPSSDCVELTGMTSREKRAVHWMTKRVFFATPQVIDNDLEWQVLPAQQVKCIVIDEAHRAQGGFAYVNIVNQLQRSNKNGFRVVALSATPGSDIQRVQQVMLNLFISDVLFRTENSIDLVQYRNSKNSKAWLVELKGKHKQFVDKFIEITRPIFKELHLAGLTYSNDSIDKVAKYTLVKAMQNVKNNEFSNNRRPKGKLMHYCCMASSLSHNFELLTLYGIRVFYTSITRSMADAKGNLKIALGGIVDFDIMMSEIRNMFGDDIELDPNKAAQADLLQGHPKLKVVKDLLMKHFEAHKGTETRAMVFTKYRDSVYDIVQTIKSADPTLKPAAFVGQNTGTKGSSVAGMRQKEQIQVVSDFKAGRFNVLVATCVAEEGLDIGEVDLIICYDTSSSPISNTQRRGRTGRKRSGDVQTILTQGYEEKRLKQAGNSRRQVEDQLFKRENYMQIRNRDAPRMVPKDIIPICLEQKIFPIDDDEDEEEEKPKRKRRKKDIVVEVDSVKKGKANKKLDDEDMFSDDEAIEIIGHTPAKKQPQHKQASNQWPPLTNALELMAKTSQSSSLSCEMSEVLSSEASSKQAEEKDANFDSDVEWESDLDYNCV